MLRTVTSLALFITVTGLVVIPLLRWSQPARLRVDLERPRDKPLTLTTDPGGVYLPYFVAQQRNPTRARPRARGDDATVVLPLTNSATRKLAIAWRGAGQPLRIRSLALETFLSKREWSASQALALLTPRRNIERIMLEGDTLVVQPNGKGPSVETRFDVAAEIRQLERTDDAIVRALGLMALACAGIRVWFWLAARRRSARRRLARRRAPEAGSAGEPDADAGTATPQRLAITIMLSRARQFSRAHAAALLTVALLLIGAARILMVVLHEPVWQYANNGDWFRLQACFGIAARGDQPFPLEVLLGDPPAIYAATHTPYPQLCYLSSQAWLIGAALALLRAGILPGAPGAFDIRVVGLVNATALILVGAGLTVLFARRSKEGGAVAAGAFALLAADPSNTLFFTGFYSEPVSLVATTAALGLAIYLLMSRRWTWNGVIVLAWALLVLGLGKTQNYLLPPWMTLLIGAAGLVSAPAPHERIRRVALLAPLALVSIVTFAIQSGIQQQAGYMQAATILLARHSLLGTWAAAASDPPLAVRVLGLPPACEPYTGAASETKLPQDCRAGLLIAPRTRLWRLVLYEPAALARVLDRAIPLTRPWLLAMTPPARQEWAGPAARSFRATWSWSEWLDGLPIQFYWGMIVLAGVGGAAAAVSVLSARFKPRAHFVLNTQDVATAQIVSSARAALSSLIVLSGFCLYVLGASLLGDGYAGLNRHIFLAHVPLLLVAAVSAMMLLATMLFMVGGWSRRRKRGAPQSPKQTLR